MELITSLTAVQAVNTTDQPLPVSAPQPIGTPLAVDRSEAVAFADMLGQGLGGVNESLKASDAILQAMAMQEPVSAHDVMLTMEKAKMELRLAVEVRDKLLESYQELMRMQV